MGHIGFIFDMKKKIKRGEIYYVMLGKSVGSEQAGNRPCIIVQNDTGNAHSTTTQIVPLTGRRERPTQPTHVVISSASGLDVISIAMVEQMRTVDKQRLGKYIGNINDSEQAQLDTAIAISVGLVV
jgi:mRNA interferase MazF